MAASVLQVSERRKAGTSKQARLFETMQSCRRLWRSSRFRWRRLLRLDPSFPRRPRVEVRRQSLTLPFFFKICSSLIRGFTNPNDIIPGIGLWTDPAAVIGSFEIKRNRIASVRSQIDMDATDIFQQAGHGPSSKRGHDATRGYAQAREREVDDPSPCSCTCIVDYPRVVPCFLPSKLG